MFFILFVIVVFIEFDLIKLWVNIVVFKLELYILLIVVVLVFWLRFVFNIVCCVGV